MKASKGSKDKRHKGETEGLEGTEVPKWRFWFLVCIFIRRSLFREYLLVHPCNNRLEFLDPLLIALEIALGKLCILIGTEASKIVLSGFSHILLYKDFGIYESDIVAEQTSQIIGCRSWAKVM